MAHYDQLSRAIVAGFYWAVESMMLESIPFLLLQPGMGIRALR